jgi:drug/metabolite transporter (DMT)-like permease
MFLGTTSWSIYGIMVKKNKFNISPLKLTSYSILFCTIIMAPFAMVEVYKGGLVRPINAFYGIFYMALFPTVIGYTIQQNTIKKLGASTAALFINLVPVFSILLSIIILKEAITIKIIISSAIIILSVIMFTQVE